MNKKLLETEFKYYIDNQSELVKKYNNKFIVIVKHEVIGAYDTFDIAFDETIKKREVGTFLIQHCFAGPESYSQIFHSRVVFS